MFLGFSENNNFKTIPLEHLKLPTDEPLLSDFEITKESLKEADFETMQNLMLTVAQADWRLFMKILVSQGYDLWLTKAHYPTHTSSCMK